MSSALQVDSLPLSPLGSPREGVGAQSHVQLWSPLVQTCPPAPWMKARHVLETQYLFDDRMSKDIHEIVCT